MRCEFLAIFLNSGLVGTTSPPRSSVYLFCNLQSASTVPAIDVKILKYFKNIWKFLSKISVWICWNSYSSSQACLPLLQFCSLCLDTHRRPQILHNHCKLNLTPQSQKDAVHVLHNHCKLNLTPKSQKDAVLHSHCTVARNTVKIQ